MKPKLTDECNNSIALWKPKDSRKMNLKYMFIFLSVWELLKSMFIFFIRHLFGDFSEYFSYIWISKFVSPNWHLLVQVHKYFPVHTHLETHTRRQLMIVCKIEEMCFLWQHDHFLSMPQIVLNILKILSKHCFFLKFITEN